MMSISSHLHLHSTKSISEQQIILPDSTTVDKVMSDFSVGQDVLVKQKDDRYYLGTVVQVNTPREQCLVKYGDNTYNWSCYKDLTKLNTSEQEELLCVICKKFAPKNKQEITVCDQCGRGYHQKCHQPEIPTTCQKEDAAWKCKRCIDSESHRLKKSEKTDLKQRRDSIQSISAASINEYHSSPSSSVRVLPYELTSLNWDTYHRVNSEQIYCYCGANGEWYNQMLQCVRCRQWYHEKCIECLQYPLYCGDRFYVFVCSICNQSKEFLRRLEMKWVDLVHLMLFNLTAYNCKKYYDLDTIVIPYINDNWHALQLPPKEPIQMRQRNQETYYDMGPSRSSTTSRTLHHVTPVGLVTEEELREMWQGNRRLHFLPIDLKMPRGRKVETDAHMKNLMMGVSYQHNYAHSETESPCPSPEIVCETSTAKINVAIVQKAEFLGAGCAKKTVPFSKMTLQRRKKLLAMSTRDRERILKRPKRRVTLENMRTKSDAEAQTKRLSLDNKPNNKNSEILPPTPPTSVSAPPTPPASNSMSVTSDLSNDCSENSNLTKVPSGIKKSTLLELTSELNTPCDTSGDETSSKSTLDLIIPPPKDFEGKNNPFLTLLGISDDTHFKNKRKSKEITLPLPLTAVIPGKPLMKPMKRQLSEKDIVVGPNGQVKRKRFRRSRNLNLNFANGQTASKTAAVVPVKTDAKEWGQRSIQSQINTRLGNCFDYALTSRRLRQRPEKPAEKDKVCNPPTPKPSPVKQEPEISMDDLKNSVNIYFGAANRIATGEKFVVKAKRIAPSGKMEYLIEWEGPSNGMT